MKLMGLIFCIIIFPIVSYADNNFAKGKILFHSEYGSFNRVYHSREYRGNNKETFSVPMRNIGFEYLEMDRYGNTAGGGIVYTNISEGKKFNLNRYEVQNETSIYVPYFFIGKDFGIWSLDIGLSYYLAFQKAEDRLYYNPEGSYIQEKEPGNSIIRDQSYLLPNLMIRLLPENSYHIKIRLGRERYNAVDSLFNTAFIYPWGPHTWEFYFALPTHISSYFPESNRRLGFNYSYKIGIINLGATLGYLAYNKKGGGDGNMYIFDPDNFSFGFNMELNF